MREALLALERGLIARGDIKEFYIYNTPTENYQILPGSLPLRQARVDILLIKLRS